jgi:hypothetical protein
MKQHYIGIACKNISNILQFVQSQFQVSSIPKIIYDELQKKLEIELSLMDLVSNSFIQAFSDFLKKPLMLT